MPDVAPAPRLITGTAASLVGTPYEGTYELWAWTRDDRADGERAAERITAAIYGSPLASPFKSAASMSHVIALVFVIVGVYNRFHKCATH